MLWKEFSLQTYLVDTIIKSLNHQIEVWSVLEKKFRVFAYYFDLQCKLAECIWVERNNWIMGAIRSNMNIECIWEYGI